MKKIIYAMLFLLPGLAMAQATSTINLPSDFNANVMSQAQGLLATSSLGGFVQLILGVLLAVVVLEVLVGALKK